MAGRIPDSFIHDLLARTDIVELIASRVEIKRAGKEFKGLSPFTTEKSPSFFVSPQKQMFFCFSSGKNGTAISFLMEYDRLSRSEEHTSELQSLMRTSYAVFCLKKKNKQYKHNRS